MSSSLINDLGPETLIMNLYCLLSDIHVTVGLKVLSRHQISKVSEFCREANNSLADCCEEIN